MADILLDPNAFLDFFGGGESSPGDNPMRQHDVPESVQRYASDFLARTIEVPVYAYQNYDVDDPRRTPEQTGTMTRSESLREIAARMGAGSNRKDKPLWHEAYNAALKSYNQYQKTDPNKKLKVEQKEQSPRRKKKKLSINFGATPQGKVEQTLRVPKGGVAGLAKGSSNSLIINSRKSSGTSLF